MAKIHVHTPFTLTKDDGTKVPFAAGSHEVDGDVASHWYVKLHTGGKPTGALGAADAADASAPINARLADLDRVKQVLAAEGKRLEALAAELGEREVAVAAREKAAAARETELDRRDAERAATAQGQSDAAAKDSTTTGKAQASTGAKVQK